MRELLVTCVLKGPVVPLNSTPSTLKLSGKFALRQLFPVSLRPGTRHSGFPTVVNSEAVIYPAEVIRMEHAQSGPKPGLGYPEVMFGYPGLIAHQVPKLAAYPTVQLASLPLASFSTTNGATVSFPVDADRRAGFGARARLGSVPEKRVLLASRAESQTALSRSGRVPVSHICDLCVASGVLHET